MIAITMGDGNGVGPEIILKAYKQKEISGNYVVVGDLSVLNLCNSTLNYNVPLHSIKDFSEVKPDCLNVVDLALLTAEQVTPGTISKEVAAASEAYVVYATKLALEHKFSAIVTLPVNKEAIRLSDPVFTGHTELIAGICGQTHYTMMLASKKLTVTHLSTHTSMEQSIKNVKADRVLEVIQLTYDALHRFLPEPRIAIAGLNPHAGENGAFGMQELNEVIPAVEKAQSMGFNVTGPLPPDTVFLRAYKGSFDAVVCMYHDQGHIPMKLLDFEGGVNVTLGLDVVRTSVDHGTAFDIAYTGKASTNSLIAAYEYAQKIQLQ